MRVFKTKPFGNWAKSVNLTDEALMQAAEEVRKVLVDANLGGNVYKKRIGLAGRGKSAGVRTSIVYKGTDRMFFVEGFAKNEQDNVDS